MVLSASGTISRNSFLRDNRYRPHLEELWQIVSNVEIDFIDRDHATTTCYIYAWHEVDGAPRNPTVLGRYTDRVERTDGRWLIAHRQMYAHGVESFPAGIMRPLPLGR